MKGWGNVAAVELLRQNIVYTFYLSSVAVSMKGWGNVAAVELLRQNIVYNAKNFEVKKKASHFFSINTTTDLCCPAQSGCLY
jgi:hypothetical protein